MGLGRSRASRSTVPELSNGNCSDGAAAAHDRDSSYFTRTAFDVTGLVPGAETATRVR